MSRIGKKPVTIPKGVDVKIQNSMVSVKGPAGSLSRSVPSSLAFEIKDGSIFVSNPLGPVNGAIWGLYRVLISNMVTGVAVGYHRDLEITGVGYKAELKGKDILLNVGLSHPVTIKAPAGITFVVEGGTKVSVKGCDKELVGQLSANIRRVRPPEPYKGKGIKYAHEKIVRKAGKTAGK